MTHYKDQNFGDEFALSSPYTLCYFENCTFPESMTGVEFTNCGFDNTIVPEGNTLNGGEQRQFKKLDDGTVWIVDGDGIPVEQLEAV